MTPNSEAMNLRKIPGQKTKLSIGLVLPDVLGTYGDDGNAVVLQRRAMLRGIDAEIVPIKLREPVPDSLDIYTLGGGEDTAQILAAEHLIADGGLTRAAAVGTPILAICAGLQILGESFRASGRIVEGLGLLDATTASLRKRMIGEITSDPTQRLTAGPAAKGPARQSSSAGEAIANQLTQPLTGFANHMGATLLGPDATPLGKVTCGTGNTDDFGAESSNDPERQVRAEGAVQGSVVATYMHGPALARNPELADALLAQAMGVTVATLPEMSGAAAAQLTDEIRALRAERLRR